MEKKIYCGSGKKKSETWLQVTLNPKKFMEYIQEYNGAEFIKLNINILPEPDKYGKTVSVSVDNWKPDGAKAAPQASPKSYSAPKPSFDDGLDLPF
ncbi:MAG: hypothetical protein ACRCW1_05460 [Anaerotignaceae bacterium]